MRRMRLLGILFTSIALFPCVGIVAQPPNDLCTSVVPQPLLIGGSIDFSGDNTNATALNDGLPGTLIGDAGLPTVWHAITLNGCARVVVEYCNTIPAFGNYWNLLSVDCPSSTSINVNAFNDTVCGDGNRQLIFDPVPQGTYYIPVLNDPFNNAAGPYSIHVTAVVCTGGTPPNDFCADVPVDTLHVGASIDFFGDNTSATSTNDGVSGSPIGDANLPTVWHAFYLPSCSKVEVSYCGTNPRFYNYWNLLSVDCPSSITIIPLALNDTICVDSNRTIVYDQLPTGTYYLPVLNDPFNNAVGLYNIELKATVCTGGTPPNDLCADVVPTPLALGTTIGFFGDNSGATTANDGLPGSVIGDANLPTVWHAFTTTVCANIRIAYCGTTPTFGNYWNLLSEDCPSNISINPSDLNDTLCTDTNRTLYFEMLPAGTYYLPVLNDPFNNAEGIYEIEVRASNCAGLAPENDLCADVTPVPLTIALPISFSGNNSGATAINDGVPGSIIGDSNLPTVWHAFTLANCANVSVAYCNTDPAFGNYWNLMATQCPSDSMVFASQVSDLDCLDGNRTIFFDSLLAGTYYIPVLTDPFNNAEGPYQIDLVATPCGLTTGIEITQEDNWLVYPNPGNGEIKLKARRTGTYKIELMDLRGSLVYRAKEHIIAGNEFGISLTGTLSPGNYIIKISDSTGRFVQKIIVE